MSARPHQADFESESRRPAQADPDARWFRTLLRTRRDRPRRRAANQPNDPAPAQVAHGVAPSACRPGREGARRHSQSTAVRSVSQLCRLVLEANLNCSESARLRPANDGEAPASQGRVLASVDLRRHDVLCEPSKVRTTTAVSLHRNAAWMLRLVFVRSQFGEAPRGNGGAQC